MVPFLHLGALLILYCGAAEASVGAKNSSSSAVARGAGISVAGESKTQLRGNGQHGQKDHDGQEERPVPPEEEPPIPLPDMHFITDYIDMAAKQINTELAYKPARPYLNIITNSSPMSLQMMGLGAWSYDMQYFKATHPRGWAGGWKVVAEYVNTTRSLLVDGHDVVVLMAKGKQCAVSFCGTHGLADWSTNLNMGTRSFLPQCGVYGVHEGFFEAFLQFMLNDAWTEEFEPYLAANCSDGVHVTGHSQGAAVGAVFAACMNGAGENVSFPDLWRFGKLVHAGRTVKTRVNVTDLWGMGGPGVSDSQFWNYQRHDGVFPGIRFFNQDWIAFDPVPWSTYPIGLTHVRSETVRLSNHPQSFGPLTDDARTEPKTVSFVPDIMNHLPPEYLRRLLIASRTVSAKVAYAEGLPERSARPFMPSKPNPYATVEATNRKWSVTPRTSATKNPAKPAWDETMHLEEYEPGDEIEIKVWDSVWPWGADKNIGTVKLSSSTFEPNGFEGWVPTESGIRLKVKIDISYREVRGVEGP